tara:strand:+ start:270 stop:953 length:684 start_codon:yes stop_codon:yes gene_type:complete
MKKNLTKIILTFLLMFFILISIDAQEVKNEFKNVTLHLLSGDTVQYKLSEIKEDHINGYRRIKNKDVWKFKAYPNLDLLYYNSKSLNKNWIYKQNKEGLEFTPKFVEKYVLGKKTAKYNYKPKKYFLLGLLSGFSIGSFSTFSAGGFFNTSRTPILIAAPVLTTFIVRTKNFKSKDKSEMNNKQLLENEYNKGYHSVKKTKNYIGSSAGGFAGVVFSILLNNLLNKD